MVGYVLIKYFRYQNPKNYWKSIEKKFWIDFHLILHKITVELKEVCMKREFFIFDRLSVKKIKFRSNKNFRPNWHFFGVFNKWRISMKSFQPRVARKIHFLAKIKKKNSKKWQNPIVTSGKFGLLNRESGILKKFTKSTDFTS